MTSIKQPPTKGFALLITLIVVTVLLSIGLTLLDLTIKQVRLASNARESEIAFHAANAGLECARFWRRRASSTFEAGANVSGVHCFDQSLGGVVAANSVPITAPADNDGYANVYNWELTWNVPNALQERCSEIRMLVASTTVTGDGIEILESDLLAVNRFPGWTGGNFICEPGARCTIAAVRGYSRACGQKDNFGTIQREVLLQF